MIKFSFIPVSFDTQVEKKFDQSEFKLFEFKIWTIKIYTLYVH